MFVTPPSVSALVQDGKLRAIGFTGAKPFPELPDVPLIMGTLPSFQVKGSWGMFFAPARTPAPIVNQLNAAIQKTLGVPAVAKVLQVAGYMPDGRDAAQTARFFREEVEEAAEAVRAVGIEPQ